MQRAESTPAKMITAVLVTCIVASAALALTYQLTKDRIAEQERAAEEKAIRAVLDGAETFSPLEQSVVDEATEATDGTPVGGIYTAQDAAGNDIGWALKVAPRGYGGPIQMVVGVDRDGLVTGVSIITQNETPGLGTKVVTEPGFLEQFAGWDAGEIDTAAKAFDAVSGATKSSNGVRKGILAAGHVYANVLMTEGGSQE